jgi:hypothetical protein
MSVMTKSWLAIPLTLLAPLACRAEDIGAKPARLVSFAELERRLGEGSIPEKSSLSTGSDMMPFH